jgi:hypothetical protein
MNHEDGAEQVAELRRTLPTFTSTPAAATDALAHAAAGLGLELSHEDMRCLAHAVLQHVEQPSMVRGVEWAYSIVEREISETQRYLIKPAQAKASADPAHVPVLRIQEHYVSGMVALQTRLRISLLALGKRFLATNGTVAAMREPAASRQPGETPTALVGVA